VLGIGFPVLRSTYGNAVIEVGDVDGVRLAGFIVQVYGLQNVDYLVRIGNPKKKKSSSQPVVNMKETVIIDVSVKIDKKVQPDVEKNH